MGILSFCSLGTRNEMQTWRSTVVPGVSWAKGRHQAPASGFVPVGLSSPLLTHSLPDHPGTPATGSCLAASGATAFAPVKWLLLLVQRHSSHPRPSAQSGVIEASEKCRTSPFSYSDPASSAVGSSQPADVGFVHIELSEGDSGELKKFYGSGPTSRSFLPVVTFAKLIVQGREPRWGLGTGTERNVVPLSLHSWVTFSTQQEPLRLPSRWCPPTLVSCLNDEWYIYAWIRPGEYKPLILFLSAVHFIYPSEHL